MTMVPVALGVMSAVGALAKGAQRPYPGAPIGAVAAAALVIALATAWFRALRPRPSPSADPAVY